MQVSVVYATQNQLFRHQLEIDGSTRLGDVLSQLDCLDRWGVSLPCEVATGSRFYALYYCHLWKPGVCVLAVLRAKVLCPTSHAIAFESNNQLLVNDSAASWF